MSPRRLRLSTESSRSDRDFQDSQQFYQYTQHSPNSNRVFIDSKGQAHDPDFMSHMFPDQNAYRKKKMEAEKARRASMGRYDDDDDDYTSDDNLMSAGSTTNARSAYPYYSQQPQFQPVRNYYSGSYGSSSYSTPTPSWHHTSALMDDDDEDEQPSPASERFSLRGWMKKKDSNVDAEDNLDSTEKSRRVLRRRRRDLEELEEDDDENVGPANEVSGAKDEDDDCAPTCTEALKQSWQGFYLRYRLGTHRLKRRMFPKKPEPQVSTSPFLHSVEEKYTFSRT